MSPESTGIIMNGTAMIGFSTIGAPKIIGALILKAADTILSFPISLFLAYLAKKTMNITTPIVIPAPVTVIY